MPLAKHHSGSRSDPGRIPILARARLMLVVAAALMLPACGGGGGGGGSAGGSTPPTPGPTASPLIVAPGASGARQTAAGVAIDSLLGEPVPVGTSQSLDGKIVIRHGFVPPTISIPAPSGHG